MEDGDDIAAKSPDAMPGIWGLPTITPNLHDWDWGDVRLPDRYHAFTQQPLPPCPFENLCAQNPARYLMRLDDRGVPEYIPLPPKKLRDSPYWKKVREEWYWKRKVEKVFIPYFGVWRKHQPQKYHAWFQKVYEMERIKGGLSLEDEALLRKMLDNPTTDYNDKLLTTLEARLASFGQRMNKEGGDPALVAVYMKSGLAVFPRSHYIFNYRQYEKERLLERAASFIFEMRASANYYFHAAMEKRKEYKAICKEIERRGAMATVERYERENEYPHYVLYTPDCLEKQTDERLARWKRDIAEEHDNDLRRWLNVCEDETRHHSLMCRQEYHSLQPKWLSNTVELEDEDDDNNDAKAKGEGNYPSINNNLYWKSSTQEYTASENNQQNEVATLSASSSP